MAVDGGENSGKTGLDGNHFRDGILVPAGIHFEFQIQGAFVLIDQQHIPGNVQGVVDPGKKSAADEAQNTVQGKGGKNRPDPDPVRGHQTQYKEDDDIHNAHGQPLGNRQIDELGVTVAEAVAEKKDRGHGQSVYAQQQVQGSPAKVLREGNAPVAQLPGTVKNDGQQPDFQGPFRGPY